MGKKTKKKTTAQHPAWLWPDPVEQSAAMSSRLDCENETKPCVYKSRVLEIVTGPPQTSFYIHEDVLHKAGGDLASYVRSDMEVPGIDDSEGLELDPDGFELVLEYLYGGCYQEYSSDTCPKSVSSLERACKLYCFAMKHNMVKLRNVTIVDIESLRVDDYKVVLDAAKLVYRSMSDIEPWFHDYVVAHTKRALVDVKIATFPWFIDVFRGSYHDLGSTIFEVFRDMYASQSEPFTPISESFEKSSLTCSTAPSTEVHSRSASVMDEQPDEEDWGWARPPRGKKSQNDKKAPQAISKGTWVDEKHSVSAAGEQSTEPELETWGSSLTHTGKEKAKPEEPEEGTVEYGTWGCPVSTEEKPLIVETLAEPEATVEMEAMPCSEREPEPEAVLEPEPEPVPGLRWDHGLGFREKKRKKKQMQAQGVIFDEWDTPIYPGIEQFIQEPAIDPETEVATQSEPTVPWDYGLTKKEKRKKRKQMEADGVIFDWLDQPIYPERGPEPKLEPPVEAEPEVEVVEVQEVESLPDSTPDEHSLGYSEPEHDAGSFHVVMALEIHHNGFTHRCLRRQSIVNWGSFTSGILECMCDCVHNLSGDDNLWLSDIRVTLDGQQFSIENEVEKTLVHVLKDCSAKQGVVNISMLLYEAMASRDEQDICIAPDPFMSKEVEDW